MQTHRKGFHCSRQSHSNETTQRVPIRQLTVLYRLHCFIESKEKDEKREDWKWKKAGAFVDKPAIATVIIPLWIQRLLRRCCCRQWWFGIGVGNIVRFTIVVIWIYCFMHKTSITLIQLSDCTNQPTNQSEPIQFNYTTKAITNA